MPTEARAPVRIHHRTAAPDIRIEALPSKLVRTLDGKSPTEGERLYVMHDPTELTEYEVVSDVAFREPNMKEWQIVVLGAKLPVISMPVSNFTTNAKDWVRLWKKRHPGCTVELVE